MVLLVENELECLESTQSFQAVSKNAETYAQTQSNPPEPPSPFLWWYTDAECTSVSAFFI